MAAPMKTLKRFKNGRLKKEKKKQSPKSDILIDHNYNAGHICLSKEGCELCVPGISKILRAKKISCDSWRNGRRIIELEVLINGLQACTKCRLGPLALSDQSVKVEMKLGLGGYFYIQCQNCLLINRIPYSKTHRTEKKGMPSFVINTKVGSAMIDSVGGPRQINNLLATLNLPLVNDKNLKIMERRAGNMIEKYADDNMGKESQMAYEKEMQEWSNKESENVSKTVNFDDELGVALIDDEFSGDQNIVSSTRSTQIVSESYSIPLQEHTTFLNRKRRRHIDLNDGAPSPSSKKKLKFMPTSKIGMTVSADHGWQKKGFDSLTGHTFLISKQNKVLKTVITHRTCGKCKWSKRNKPGTRAQPHRCVWNHNGSARSMESQAGLEALKSMSTSRYASASDRG